MTSQPNIVLVFSDNLGFGELGVYGGGLLRGAPTPRLDALAAQGFRLLNMNMESQCTPSRSALMTGRFPLRSGTCRITQPHEPGGLVRWEKTLAQVLSQAGYATGHFGKWHLGNRPGRYPNDRGFDQWWGIDETHDTSLWLESPGFDPSLGPVNTMNASTLSRASLAAALQMLAIAPLCLRFAPCWRLGFDATWMRS